MCKVKCVLNHNKYNENPDNAQLNFSTNKLIDALTRLDAIWGIQKSKHRVLLKKRNKFLLTRKKIFLRARLLSKRRKSQQRAQKLLAENLLNNLVANQLKLPKKQNYSDLMSQWLFLHM